MWKVYILLSLKDSRTYTGSTSNLTRRIHEHNLGHVSSTKNRRPLKLIYTQACEKELDARKLEKYFKTAAGRKKLKDLFKTF